MVKYLGKKVVAFGGALLFSTLANAVEVYNKDGDTFNVGGRLLVGTESNQQLKDETYANHKNDDYVNSLRINLSGTTDVGNGWKGFATAEYQFNMEPEAFSEKRLSVRQSYAGLKNDRYSVSFGKDYSAYYQVAEYTDQFQTWGGEASTYRVTGFEGARIAKSTLLQYYTDKVHVSFMAAGGYDQIDRQDTLASNDDVVRLTKDYEHNGSFQYKLNDALKLGVAYTTAHFTDIDEDQVTEQKFAYGLTYNANKLTLALLGIAAKDYGVSNAYYNGAEAFVAYQVSELGNKIYGGYNYLSTDIDGGTYKPYNYFDVGYAHYFTKKLYAFAEYRYDARTDLELENYEENDSSTFGVYLRYSFS
jgi:predicted porin